jgi:hypothetical protein
MLTGLIYLRRILVTHFSDRVVSLILAGFAFGTNLYWYTLFQGTMAHVYSFALVTAFVWYAMEWHGAWGMRHGVGSLGHGAWGMRHGAGSLGHGAWGNQHGIWSGVRLGLLLGLISLIRPTNIIIVIFSLLYGVISAKDLRISFKNLAADSSYLLPMTLTVVLVWVPQMIYWKEMTGHWLYFSYGSDERFFFGDPAIIKGLFSYRKGLFIYTPLMIFAFAGIYIWLKHRPHCLSLYLYR